MSETQVLFAIFGVVFTVIALSATLHMSDYDTFDRV